MKLTKKIIVAALAVVGLSFTACMKDIAGTGLIKNGSNGIDAYVDAENKTEDVIRDLKTARQQHSGGVYTIRQTVNGEGDGMLGVVFGLKENKSKHTYDFWVIGTSIQKNGSNMNEKGYISYFVNVKKEDFQEKNFGAWVMNGTNNGKGEARKVDTFQDALDASDDESITLPYEYEHTALGFGKIIPNTNASQVYNSSTKKYEVSIAIYPEYSTSTQKFTGNYIVKAGKNLKLKDSDDGKYKEVDSSEGAVYSPEFKLLKVFAPATDMGSGNEGKIGKVPENGLGYYCNVYAGQTLVGEWELQDVINMVVEE
ncbi:MAG: hypothetical protein J6X54_04140 [Treponema sp.]|nr:hypothetical protein [Treponema sp.]